MKWFIQENLISNQAPYVEALKDLNIPYQMITCDSEFIRPNIPGGQKAWFFGSTELITQILNSPLNSNIIYDQDKMLNFDDQIIPLKDVNFQTLKIH